MTIASLRAALDSPNVKAFLRLIRERESGQGDDAYTIINGGSHFDAPPWAHPWPDGTPTTRGGKAAGAYQFLPSTWKRVAEQTGLPDFSPDSQDLGAVYLIAGRRALDDVLAGNINLAIAKCRPEWTSLPGAAESSASWTLEKARAVYEKWGGTFADVEAEQDAAPIEDRGKPYTPEPQPQESAMGAGLILSLVQSILPMFTGGAQAKIGPILAGVTAPPPAASGDAKTEAIIQLATGIMASMLTASGHANPAQATDQQKIAATASVAANPALVQKVEDDAMARLEKMAPTFDKLIAIDKATNEAALAGKDAAAKRSLLDRWDMTKALVLSSEGLAWVIVVGGFAGVAVAAWNSKVELALSMLGVVGTIIGTVLKNRSQAYDYRFDGTPSSNAANAINAEIAQRK